MLETIGLFIYAGLFVFSGLNHIKNHSAMANFTTESLGNCPVRTQLGFLGGAPTGVFLVVTGVAASLGQVWALYALTGFLTVVAALYHRNLKDPANMKHLSLIGATLALAALV